MMHKLKSNNTTKTKLSKRQEFKKRSRQLLIKIFNDPSAWIEADKKYPLKSTRDSFPSGLTIQEAADALGVTVQHVTKWTQGIRVPPCRQEHFFKLAGFESNRDFQDWIESRANL